MEHGYFCGKHLVRPNSYTLTAVLLGVDGGLDALKVLDRFEKDYGNDGGARTVDDNDGIVTVQVYNAVAPKIILLKKESHALTDGRWHFRFFKE